MSKLAHSAMYQDLLEQISRTYVAGRSTALQAVNTQLLQTYWQVGQQIVEFEQGGKDRAEYGASLIDQLPADLRLRLGKRFNRSNLIYMRLFYLRYPIGQTLSDLLSWSHYVELLMLDDPLERNFYHRILRCFVLIDLKIGDVQHHDIGQMNLYLGYFAKEENTSEDQPPIGIILSRNKDELLVEYATYQMNSQLFIQKYQLYL
ncbi:MAG: PDDEXK nuclease domain-containing protein, partial [Zoogloeaceae bacterium]|nr:PDDEXK nuclease domain-containing protein [Zoogloeaceae bacterium]